MSDQFDDLKRLADMRDKGDIDQAEFEKLKAQLLSEQASVSDEARSLDEKPETQKTTQGDTRSIESQTRWWLIGTGLLMAVGSFLPWAQAGIFSVAGTDGDGVFTLIGGVIVALVGVANRASVVTGLGTAVVAGFSLWIVVNVFGNFDVLDVGSIGSGLYLTGLASLFAIIAGFKVFGEARQS